MRLFLRTMKPVEIARREVRADAMGAAVESFSAERTVVRGNVFPSTAGLRNEESGLLQARTAAMLFPAGAEVSPGDALYVDGEAWRCVSVTRWTMHTAVSAERMACAT